MQTREFASLNPLSSQPILLQATLTLPCSYESAHDSLAQLAGGVDEGGTHSKEDSHQASPAQFDNQLSKLNGSAQINVEGEDQLEHVKSVKLHLSNYCLHRMYVLAPKHRQTHERQLSVHSPAAAWHFHLR